MHRIFVAACNVEFAPAARSTAIVARRGVTGRSLWPLLLLLAGSIRAQPLPDSVSGAYLLDVTTTQSEDLCGQTFRDVPGTVPLKSLLCGRRSIGGGLSQVPDSRRPAGSTNRFALSCVDDVCAVGSVGSAEGAFDCTAAGCRFGPPFPVSNAGLSLCVESSFTQPASGPLSLATGEATLFIQLVERQILTGNPSQPCPICRSGTLAGPPCDGTPASPCHGVCDGGPNHGAACISTTSGGVTNACPAPAPTVGTNRCYRGANNDAICVSGGGCPGGLCAQFVGDMPITLSPLTTGTLSVSAETGLFCPGQTITQRGAFRSAICQTGPNSGMPCTTTADCDGALCRTGALNNYCNGGTNDGMGCTTNTNCGGGGQCVKAGTLVRFVRLTGSPAGPLSVGVPAPATLVSLFCLSPTTNLTLNAQANLPGLGAETIPVTLLLIDPSTTTTTSTSTSLTTSTSTSTTTTTTTSTTTLPPCIDPDGDGVCLPDDNCPFAFNPDQTDVDGDLSGDACDAVEGALTVTQVRMRPDSSRLADNGSITLRGDFTRISPADVVTTALGVVLHVVDGVAIRVNEAWPPSACVTTSSGRSTCRTANGPTRLKLQPHRSSPGAYRLVARLRRLGIQPPFAGPVNVTLMYGGSTNRVGAISACEAAGAGLKCG